MPQTNPRHRDEEAEHRQPQHKAAKSVTFDLHVPNFQEHSSLT